MKFKVGDKARVRKDIEVGNCFNNVVFTSSMEKYKGQIIAIENIIHNDNNVYFSNGWLWSSEMLEPVEEEKKMRNIDIIENDEKFKGHGACIACYMLKTGSDGCNPFECNKCEFNSIKACYDFLGQEYKGSKIKLTKFEYDILDIFAKNFLCTNTKLNYFNMFKDMKKKGYFKDIDLGMKFKDILSNCEVEE